MLEEADRGILFRPPQNVIDEFPQYPVVTDYDDFRTAFIEASNRDLQI
jgi:phosphoserine/homoserine phosphotransferase